MTANNRKRNTEAHLDLRIQDPSQMVITLFYTVVMLFFCSQLSFIFQEERRYWPSKEITKKQKPKLVYFLCY
jgi:hypothetical protein